MTLFSFIALFASLRSAAISGGLAAALFAVGVFIGSLAWWWSFSELIHFLGKKMSRRATVIIMRVTGVLMIALGLFAIALGIGFRV